MLRFEGRQDLIAAIQQLEGAVVYPVGFHPGEQGGEGGSLLHNRFGAAHQGAHHHAGIDGERRPFGLIGGAVQVAAVTAPQLPVFKDEGDGGVRQDGLAVQGCHHPTGAVQGRGAGRRAAGQDDRGNQY